MNHHDTPPFEQYDTPETLEWKNPNIDKVAAVLKEYAAQQGLAVFESTGASGILRGAERALTLQRDDGTVVASVRQVKGDDTINRFGINFAAADHPAGYGAINFYIEGEAAHVYALESPEIVLAEPSQEARGALQSINKGLNNLVANWVADPDKYGFQILNEDEEPLSQGEKAVYLQFLASMLETEEPEK